MKIVYFFLFILLISLSACSEEKQSTSDSLVGHWLVLYPDHELTTRSQRDVYKKYQDSVVNLFGLKLLQFEENGGLVEIDSLFQRKGKWTLNEENFRIQEGGKGFNPFVARFENFENDTLRLRQILPLDNEKIKVVWHLKKLDGDTAALKLVTEEANQWRMKPAAPETEEAIRKRLISMLSYYSDYLKLVSKESSYFLVPRIPLPFRYYQHRLAVKDTIYPGFRNVFYNEDDAKKAHQLLASTVTQLQGQFEWDENFVLEYAKFFRRMTFRLGNAYASASQTGQTK